MPERQHIAFWCPGCKMAHAINHGSGPGPRWTWNGSEDSPTFTPSILVRYDHMSAAGRAKCTAFRREHGRDPTPTEVPYDVHNVCHSFVTDGRIRFLDDCTHELRGQTVDLKTWSYDD